MTEDKNKPELIEDDALDQAAGGADAEPQDAFMHMPPIKMMSEKTRFVGNEGGTLERKRPGRATDFDGKIGDLTLGSKVKF